MAEDKCKHCGKEKDLHEKKTKRCPEGKKHKSFGYLQFSDENIFELKKSKRISCAAGKAKGRNLQNDFAKRIGELLNLPVGYDETISSREMGQSGTDVRLIGIAKDKFPFSVEAKAGNSFNFKSAVEQARKNTLPNTDWLLVTRRDRDKAIVSIDCDVFFALMKKLIDSEKE